MKEVGVIIKSIFLKVGEVIKLPSYFSLLFVFGVLVFLALINPVYSSPLPSQNVLTTLPAAPAGLKNYFTIGLANGPDAADWMTSSNVPWDARYQYIAGGVNTPGNWKTWQWDQLPPGQFALDYMNQSGGSNYLPVFTWYQMLQSSPANGSNEADKDFSNLNNPSTMNSYFSDFKLLLDKAKEYGKLVIIHVEPDLWGYLERRSPNPNNSTASVASSGYGDVVANYPNTAAGFARALVALRDKYAPNALLGFHISPWATQTYGNLGTDTTSNFNVAGTAQDIANFYNQTQANFDLLFYDISDRDAGYYQVKYGDSSGWWDLNNVAYPNFNRFHQFVSYMTGYTGKRGILWQVPLGNTLYRTMNNTDYHYQDNKAQYYLNSSNQHIQEAVNSGLMGIMFGSGGNEATIYTDHGDGVTNPAPINGNNSVSTYSDDDGGHIRAQAGAYYSRGPVYFGNPKFNSTPSAGSTVALSTLSGTAVSTTFSIGNSGSGGPALNVSVPALSGPGASSFSVLPAGAFNIAAGGSQVTITIGCTPASGGTFNATLSYTTNDPELANATFNLVCKGLTALTVTAPDENSPGLTLSTALNTYVSGQSIIVFNVSGNQVNISGANPLTANRGPVIIDGGGCNSGQPALTIDGSGATGNGLTLGTGVELRNIRIRGFGGIQLVASGGGNKLGKCVVIIKS